MNENENQIIDNNQMIAVARLRKYRFGAGLIQTQEGLMVLGNTTVLVPEGDDPPEITDVKEAASKEVASHEELADALKEIPLTVAKQVIFKRGLMFTHSEDAPQPKPLLFVDGLALYVADVKPEVSDDATIPFFMAKSMFGNSLQSVKVPMNMQIATAGLAVGIALMGKDSKAKMKLRHGKDCEVVTIDPDKEGFALVGRAEVKGDIAVIENGGIEFYDKINVMFEPGKSYRVRTDLPEKLVSAVAKASDGDVVPVAALVFDMAGTVDDEFDDDEGCIAFGKQVLLVGKGTTAQEFAGWAPKEATDHAGFTNYYETSMEFPDNPQESEKSVTPSEIRAF